MVLCEPVSHNRKNSEGKDEQVNGYNVVLEDTILFPEGGGQVIGLCEFPIIFCVNLRFLIRLVFCQFKAERFGIYE